MNKVLKGDALTVLKTLPSESINCTVTSPPYWGLRDYGTKPIIWDDNPDCKHEWVEHIKKPIGGKGSKGANVGANKNDFSNMRDHNVVTNFCKKCGAWKGSLGLEPTFELYIKHLCDIFDETQRVLRKDGTLWVNLGDSYSTVSGSMGKGKWEQPKYKSCDSQMPEKIKTELPSKSLTLIPFRFAIEMVNRGWILRNVIIWHKPNCMPSSAKDRFTVDFEYLFFFVKSKEKSTDIKEWLPNRLKPEEASWLAAMIDTEGTIGTRYSKYTKNRRGSIAPYITVNNSCKALVDKCYQLTKLGTIRKDTAKTNFDMWRWEVTHNRAISIIGEVYPYLIQKKEQAKVAIALQKTNFRRGSPKGSNNGSVRLTKEEWQIKESYWRMMKQLNQKEIKSSELPEPNLNRYSGCEKYWFEQQFEPHTTLDDLTRRTNKYWSDDIADGGTGKQNKGRDRREFYGQQGRNKRTVWTIPTKPYPEAHFAVYPAELIRTCIKAGCPKEVCKKCGKAREKVFEVINRTPKKEDCSTKQYAKSTHGNEGERVDKGYTDCGCNAGFRPGVVLDPFAGSGTTLEEAIRQGKNYIGIELKDDYIDLINKRLNRVQVSLI